MSQISKEQAFDLLRSSALKLKNGGVVVNASKGLIKAPLPLTEALSLVDLSEAYFLRDDVNIYRLMVSVNANDVRRFDVDEGGLIE